MADYAPNFTARYKLTYSFEGDTHVNTTRWPSANTQSTNVTSALIFWTQFLTDTASLRHDTWDVISAEYAAADSNVFLPALAPTEFAAGTITASSGASTRIAHSIWGGRSIGGARCRFQMFGLYWATLEEPESVNFYISPAEDAIVSTVAATLFDSPMVGPDDEAIAVWRARVAYKQNDAWVAQRRRGG